MTDDENMYVVRGNGQILEYASVHKGKKFLETTVPDLLSTILNTFKVPSVFFSIIFFKTFNRTVEDYF